MKAFIYYLSLISLFSLNCTQRETNIRSPETLATTLNITEEMIAGMHWMNQPRSFEVENQSLKIIANKGTDFFNNPEDSSIIGTAPFLYQEIEGDFVAKALVQPDFSSQWNASALMLHIDSTHWIKFAFENSDATGPTIVSVVTKGSSDDANGVILDKEERVWLAIVRKNNIYSMHWSLDGTNFKMARLTSMINQKAVKIGIEAQSPVGDNATHQVFYFEIEKRTVHDLRNIN